MNKLNFLLHNRRDALNFIMVIAIFHHFQILSYQEFRFDHLRIGPIKDANSQNKIHSFRVSPGTVPHWRSPWGSLCGGLGCFWCGSPHHTWPWSGNLLALVQDVLAFVLHLLVICGLNRLMNGLNWLLILSFS